MAECVAGDAPRKAILVIGGCGYVAQFLLQSLLEHEGQFAVHATHRPGRSLEGMPTAVKWHEMHPSSAVDVESTLTAAAPDVVVNCAAMSNLKQCEMDPGAAEEANCLETLLEHLKKVAASRPVLFVHFSTDIVFDGNPDCTYSEDSVAEPVNAYGCSKLKFDALLTSVSVPACVVLRPPNILGPKHPFVSHGGKFLQWLDGQLQKDEPSRLFVDEYRNYVWVEDLVAVTMKLICEFPDKLPPFKLMHCGGPDSLNRLEVAEALASAKGYALEYKGQDGSMLPRILPTKRADIDLGYPSPLCIRFSSDKVESFLGRPMRPISACIAASTSRI